MLSAAWPVGCVVWETQTSQGQACCLGQAVTLTDATARPREGHDLDTGRPPVAFGRCVALSRFESGVLPVGVVSSVRSAKWGREVDAGEEEFVKDRE